ncbi:hypothetical protein [Agrobacterium tumefaciens]|uniref:hypothetical protein n=1 Tax=Agrobacterium tumefaciens TaxID=358 RepID=UPI00220840A4|nr:hypothetical protein FY143_22985 [Agrobacterium tumefaciens]UXT84280.1 hypothetical protein FY131_22865 [Agrobacterium tumefaciens]
MAELRYVVTADFVNREEDGTSHEDGSRVYKAYPRRETWTFPAATPIGEIMEAVDKLDGYFVNVTITVDRVSAQPAHEERMAAIRATRSD